MLTAGRGRRRSWLTCCARRGVPDEAAQAVLDPVRRGKLIDDAMFARAWVTPGITAADWRAGRSARSSDSAACRRTTSRRRSASSIRSRSSRPRASWSPVGSRVRPVCLLRARMRRLAGVLARKGYPAGLAYRVVREALEQEPEDGRVPVYDLDALPSLTTRARPSRRSEAAKLDRRSSARACSNRYKRLASRQRGFLLRATKFGV